MKMWLCPVTTVSLAALVLLSSGTASILKQNQSFYFLSMNIQAKLSMNYVYIQKLKRNQTCGSGDLLCCCIRLCSVLLRSEAHSERKHKNTVQKSGVQNCIYITQNSFSNKTKTVTKY